MEDSSAAGVRSSQLIQVMRDEGWAVCVCSPCKSNAAKARLEAHHVHTVQVEANHNSFDSFIANMRPDYVLFDRFVMEEQFGWRVRQASPSSICVIDTQDLHFIRRERKRALEEGKTMEEIVNIRAPLKSSDMLREIASIRRSDLTLVVSSWEKELLIREYKVPEHQLHLAPFFYSEPQPWRWPDWSDRLHFFMLGNFRHRPNWDACHWAFKEIWPRIRLKLPHAELHVYGAYADKASVLLSSEGFMVKGTLPSRALHSKISQHRINLAPLRFGAGVKGKITDGWWSGLPCVTTPIGAEGMQSSSSTDGWGGAIGSTAEEIADKAVALYCDKLSWEQAQWRGVALMRELFTYKANALPLIEALERAGARGSNANRLTRGEGMQLDQALLYYHSNRSNEFFSKYIMAKKQSRPKNSHEQPPDTESHQRQEKSAEDHEDRKSVV